MLSCTLLWVASALGVCLWSQPTDGAKILAIPFPVYSHVAESNAIAIELINRGHQVIFYLPESFNTSKYTPDISYIKYGVNTDGEEVIYTKELLQNMSRKKLSHLELIRAYQIAICPPLLEDVDGLEKLRQEKFDFALIDYLFFAPCNLLIPFNLSLPYAVIGSLILPLSISQPVATSVMPFYMTTYTPSMSFHQRLINTVAHLLSVVAIDYIVKNFDYSKMAPGLDWKEVQMLPQKAELFLENRDFIFDSPKPLMPNFVQVGGLTVKAANPLPSTIQSFFDEATNGVIIASFGSLLQPTDDIQQIFLNVFRKLKQNVYLKADDERKVGNVLISKWLPQNDALAHPNTRLMIYHCGNNGMYECLYHGVPLLCLPQAGDQFSNSHKLDYLQIGRVVHVSDVTEEFLLETILNILNDPKYSENMKRLSRIFHDRPEMPAERAASALEHVIKYGGKHLRLDQVHQSAFQLLTGDVWLAIFSLLLLFLKIVIFIFYFCRRGIRSMTKLKQN